VSRLRSGFTLVVAVYALVGVLPSLTSGNDNPALWLSLAAWGLWGVAFVSLMLLRVTGTGHLSPGGFIAVCASLATVVGLDLWAVAGRGDGGRDATAALSAAALFLVIATLRPARDVVVATMVLGGAVGGTVLATTALTAQNIPPVLVTIVLMIAPGLIGVWLVSGTSRIRRQECDRMAAISSSAGAGLASNTILARLDRDAETLLDAVAHGITPLPLSSTVAAEASLLATELRHHLLAAHSDTIN
jgi:hypothetical protein